VRSQVRISRAHRSAAGYNTSYMHVPPRFGCKGATRLSYINIICTSRRSERATFPAIWNPGPLPMLGVS